jgi:hypothetical protein
MMHGTGRDDCIAFWFLVVLNCMAWIRAALGWAVHWGGYGDGGGLGGYSDGRHLRHGREMAFGWSMDGWTGGWVVRPVR